MMERLREIGVRALGAPFEMDRPILWGILRIVVGGVSVPVTLLLIILHFSPEMQGYYYTFASLLALQVFVELGLGQVIQQFASHEWSRLELDPRGQIVGSPEALSRLVSLGRLAVGWYAAAGGLLAVGLGAAGFLFFSRAPQGHPEVSWTLPWLALCVLTGVKLATAPLWSILEGCNQVSQVYAFRVGEGILGAVGAWIAVVAGAGLWTGSVVTGVGLLWAALYLRKRYCAFFRTFYSPPGGPRIPWRAEVWPMQWRIALTWLSGYLAYSLYTPVMFHYHGPRAAGQMGMTWSLIGALSAVASLWVTARTAQFGILIARRDYPALDRLFVRCTAACCCVALAGALLIWLAVHGLYSMEHPASHRLLPPLPCALFLAATFLMLLSFPQAVYLRAHKKEPFLVPSVAGGLLVGSCTWLLGSRWGAMGMAAGYLAVTALQLPVGTLVWSRCRRAWHAAEPAPAAPAIP